MKMNNEHPIAFDMPYNVLGIFKEKECETILRILRPSRLGEIMKFESYVSVSFEDNDPQCFNPVVTEYSVYDKKRTNGMLFNLNVLDTNGDVAFDTLFLYQLKGNNGLYGYVLYNTITGRCVDKKGIEKSIEELFVHLNATLCASKFAPVDK